MPENTAWEIWLEAALTGMGEMRGATGERYRAQYAEIAEVLLRAAHATMGRWEGVSRLLLAAHLTLGQVLGASAGEVSYFLVGKATEMVQEALRWLRNPDD